MRDILTDMKGEELFIDVVGRINRYMIVLGVFLFIYFLIKTKVDIFLFLLALMNMAFALLSHKHLRLTNRLLVELEHAKKALNDATEEIRDTHSMT